ncbi:kinase-like domain-containing protein [Phakopsora pachyrhizi]|nr:kinase-like domain-containing protein [Phakopsora pachyrhizi]
MKDCVIEDASLILAEHYGIEEWTDPSVFRQDDVWAVGRVFPKKNFLTLTLSERNSATVESQKELRNFRIRPYPCSSISVADFQFLTKIGQGAFGEVWFGRSLRDNKLCAIKAIDKRNTNYPPVTEYLGAGDVFDKLAVIGYLDEYDAKLLVAEMACALDDLRKCGVVHRDFNTENILVENHGHLKLTDFGLSKFIWRRRTSSGTGTMVIRAPKMIRGAEYDYSADWYSLRVFAYEIIFCRTPFMNHLNSLPKDVFYDKLMSKDPKTRLVGLADIMKHPWLSELELYKVQNRSYKTLWSNVNRNLKGALKLSDFSSDYIHAASLKFFVND